MNNMNSHCRLTKYFCSETVSNLSKKVQTEQEIEILRKGFGSADIENEINKSELQQNFEEFSHKIRLK